MCYGIVFTEYINGAKGVIKLHAEIVFTQKIIATTTTTTEKLKQPKKTNKKKKKK